MAREKRHDSFQESWLVLDMEFLCLSLNESRRIKGVKKHNLRFTQKKFQVTDSFRVFCQAPSLERIEVGDLLAVVRSYQAPHEV
jgi:hypothetical protein